MIKRVILLLSFGFYALAFVLTYIVMSYPTNMIFGALGVCSTLASLGVKK